MTDEITANPLCWPYGWKREGGTQQSRFGGKKQVTIKQAVDFVLDQLRLMGIPDFNVIISSDLKLRNDGLPYANQREPEDKGASVWWRSFEGHQVIALDKYNRIADNLWAIGKTIEALRGIERWGGGQILDRAFTGFTALPSPGSDSWRSVIGYHGSDLTEAKAAYIRARKAAHPDHGGSNEQFAAVQKAWEKAEQEL